MAPTTGTIVHYVMESGPHHGECRPAIVVKTWGTDEPYPANMQVFTDGTNDGQDAAQGTLWRTSVPYRSEGGAPAPFQSWHHVYECPHGPRLEVQEIVGTLESTT